jgi:DNA polymerase III subunit epsilon
LPRADAKINREAPLQFVAIDVETANSSRDSICAIGVAHFSGGQLGRTWSTLVDPCCSFATRNIAVHGILPGDVRDAPKWPDVWQILKAEVTETVVVSHSHFDRTAVSGACGRYGLEMGQYPWIDSIKAAKRAWPDLPQGYGLNHLTRMLGLEHDHHDALSDAIAAGEVLIRALDHSKTQLADWAQAVSRQEARPRSRKTFDANPIHLEGAPIHAVVFTGSLMISRARAVELAREAGWVPAERVTRSTTAIVVGLQDLTKLNGHCMSSTERRARELIAQGHDIRIFTESEFFKALSGK